MKKPTTKRAKIFAGIEAETGSVPKGTHFLSIVCCAVGLRAVLNHI